MDDLGKEIRTLLCGRLAYDETTGLLTAEQRFFRGRASGYHRGTDSVRFFGVKAYRFQYRITGSVEQTQQDCVRALMDFGRQVLLVSAPDALAILRRPTLLNPSVLTLEAQEDRLLFTVYIARSPMIWLNISSILKKWEEDRPKTMEEMDLTMIPVSKKKERKQKDEKEMTPEKE